MPTTSKTDKALVRAMKASLKAYAQGSSKFFDFLSDDVRIFNVNSMEPMVGRKAFASAFEGFKTKRKVAVVSQDVQASDGRAILSQTLEIATNGIASLLRQTVVWEREEGGEWKMSHIHNALVGQPAVVGKLPTTSRMVRVLNERIATAAAAVGAAQ